MATRKNTAFLQQVRRDVTAIARKAKKKAHTLPPEEQERVIEGLLPTSGATPRFQTQPPLMWLQELKERYTTPLAAGEKLWGGKLGDDFLGHTLNACRVAALSIIEDLEMRRLSYGDAQMREMALSTWWCCHTWTHELIDDFIFHIVEWYILNAKLMKRDSNLAQTLRALNIPLGNG